jgi:6-phosphogluconolactonase (cycloisomerase 2 family)
MGPERYSYEGRQRTKQTERQPRESTTGSRVLLWVCVLANQYFLYRLSEAGNKKYCYKYHAGSGLRFIKRHDDAKLQHTVASLKSRVLQDLSTHAKESISLQKASECTQSHVIVSYGKCGSLGDVGVIVKHAVCDYVVMLVYSRLG